MRNICIYASPTRSKPVAIVVPNFPALENLAHGAPSSNTQHMSSEALVSGEVSQQLALQHLQTLGKNTGLASFEIVEGLLITDGEDWTPMNVSL